MNSAFFEASLRVCDSFKIVSNMSRDNEPEGEEKESAGARFFKWILEEVKPKLIKEHADKLKLMIFCGNI